MLTEYANWIAAKDAGSGKVLACVVVPDYSRATKHELQRLLLISRHQAYRYKKPFCSCLVKNKVKNPFEFEDKLRHLENAIRNDKAIKGQGTGVAFLMIDSIATAQFFEKEVS